CRTPDRRICSYLAEVGPSVVVTNSLAQLDRLRLAAAKKVESLRQTPEYTFFRDRYPRTDGDNALVVVSDATIRRWVSPRWRIAASRRIRAAALMADLQAEHLSELWSDGLVERRIHDGMGLSGGGAIHLRSTGVQSEVYGNLAFLTPIRELEIEKVSREEASAYRIFHDSYQRRWRVFDPIGLNLALRPDGIEFDLTVMPLIEGSDYRDWIEFTQGVDFDPSAGHRHDDSLLHFIFSVNCDSEPVRDLGGMLSDMNQGPVRFRPLGWVGRSIELWIERDQDWQKKLEENPDGGMPRESDLFQTPVVAAIEVQNPLILTGFLTMIRGLAMGSAPGMTQWQTVENEGMPYVKISATESARRSMGGEDYTLCYATNGRHFYLSLREDVMKRTLAQFGQRTIGEGETASDGGAGAGSAREEPTSEKRVAEEPEAWLGRNVGFELRRSALRVLDILYHNDLVREAQRSSWSNLAILNEWRRLYPGIDAVAFHEHLWQVHLRCPSGREYVWNEEAQTYESPAYGHPLEPKTATTFLTRFDEFELGRFGLTFEHDGLRARVSLER
ncbi:MAG: hypothetical protein KDC38_08165, partial [Planctomycetes bacterium]|nr:hypothetical protein [Planctomycetota bacterium]